MKRKPIKPTVGTDSDKDFADAKSKSPSFQGKKFSRSDVRRDVRKPYRGPNNIAWRTGDAVMTKLTANLPFGLAAGLAQDLTIEADEIGSAIPVTFRQPGIMTVVTELTAGGDSEANFYYNSPANLAFRKIYSYVRHANSGSKNYEAVDMGMYFVALGQALGLLGYLQRALRLLNEYSTTNRYTPAKLLEAMGIDHVDLQSHQPEFKFLISWFGKALGSLAFPDLPYFRACYEAYKFVVRDNDSPKEQFYMLVPYRFGVYNPTLTTAGGGVDFSNAYEWKYVGTSTLMTFANLVTYTHRLVDVLLSDEDIGIISGDILKAFKDTGLFKAEPFGEDYDVIVKEDELLQQIHNCHPVTDKNTLADYRQLPGNTNQAPYMVPSWLSTASTDTGNYNIGKYFIVDAFSKDPDPLEVVNCSVLNPVYTCGPDQAGTNYGITKIFCDLHLPILTYVVEQLSPLSGYRDITYYTKRWGSAVTDLNFNTAHTMTNFDWHPMNIRATGTNGNIFIIGDIQNIRFFSKEVGIRIHDNSLLSLFAFQDHNFY